MSANLLTQSSPRARQPAPETSNVKLTWHQGAMLHRCQEIENNQEEANVKYPFLILGTKPGSGKSYVILAHILAEKLRNTEQNKYTPPNIIVVPANLYAQWTYYFNSFFKNIFTVNVQSPTPPQNPNDMSILYVSDDTTLMQLRYNLNTLFYANIILIPTILYKLLATELNSFRVGMHRAIFDEIDSIENMVDTYFPAKYTWFVSASFDPDKIGAYSEDFPYTNQKGNLERIADITCDVDPEFVNACFQVPELSSAVYQCLEKDIDRAWDIFMATRDEFPNDWEFFNIQRLANINKYNTKLIHVNKISRDMVEFMYNYATNLAIALRVAIETKEAAADTLKRFGNNGGNNFPSFISNGSYFNQAQETENLSRFRDNANEGLDNLDMYRTKLIMVLGCIKGLSKKTKCCNTKITDPIEYGVKLMRDFKKNSHCIICSGLFEYEDIEADNTYNMPVKDTFELSSVQKFNEIPKNMTKMNTLKYIINVAGIRQERSGSNGPKIIVFCDNGTLFDSMTKLGIELGKKVQSLDNQDVKIVTKVINDFGHNDTDILLIESNLYGCGLNLEMCTDLVLFHNMDNEEQVIGRAQRPGRVCELMVHKLCYPNEIAYNEE